MEINITYTIHCNTDEALVIAACLELLIKSEEHSQRSMEILGDRGISVLRGLELACALSAQIDSKIV